MLNAIAIVTLALLSNFILF